MTTVDCLTECPKCNAGYIKAYNVTDLTLVDPHKRYDVSLCASCTTENNSSSKSILNVYNNVIDAGYSNILSAAKALKDFWRV